jgi:hypothetical protein
MAAPTAVPAPSRRPALLDFAGIAAAAAELRERAGVETAPYSGRAIIERCFPHVLVTGGELPRGVAEVVETRGGKATIWYNRRMNTAAHRVAVAHGLAHLIFDAPSGRLECGASSSSAGAPERRADLFAGELLTPFADLDRHFEGEIFPRDPVDRRVFDDEVDHAASKFKVPAGFLRWRLYDLLHLRKTNFRVG